MLKSLFLSILLLTVIPNAHAELLDEVYGIFTDPLKISKGTENLLHMVERAALHAERVQGQMNADVEARLQQVNDIIRETRNGLHEEVSFAFDRFNDAQSMLFLNSAKLVRCSSVVSTEEIAKKLAEALNDLGKRNPRISIFGWTVLTAEVDPQDIKSPIESFREAKELFEQSLSQIQVTDHPSKITDMYADFAALARDTRCHYQEDSGKWVELYVDYELEYIRKQKYWTAKVEPL